MVTDEMIRVALLAFQSGDMDWSSQDEELMRFALEEAFSAMPKPKPVTHLVWLQGRRAADDVEDYYEVARPGDKSVDGSDPFPVYATPPTLEAALSAAEPVSSRNDEAGYVEFLNEDVPYIVRDIQGAVAILMDLETRNVIGYRVYDPDSVFAPPTPPVAVKDIETVIEEMRQVALAGDNEDPDDWDGWPVEKRDQVDQWQGQIRSALYAASRSPSVAVKVAMTDDEVNQWIGACNHEPARETLRHYLELRAALSAQVQDVATHRHKKRGSEYALIGVGKMQVENWCEFTTEVNHTEGREYAFAGKSVDMREVAIYRSVDDGSLWVRPIEEFNDGRFEALPAAPAKQEG